MLFFHHKVQRAELRLQDFKTTMAQAVDGDVIYCDPPYVPASDTARFTQYAQEGFSLQEQTELGQLAERLSQQGIPVLLSNHDTAFTRHTYHKARIDAFGVQRFISCKGAQREKAQELLALFS
jgi:DNA adenine methylase